MRHSAAAYLNAAQWFGCRRGLPAPRTNNQPGGAEGPGSCGYSRPSRNDLPQRPIGAAGRGAHPPVDPVRVPRRSQPTRAISIRRSPSPTMAPRARGSPRNGAQNGPAADLSLATSASRGLRPSRTALSPSGGPLRVRAGAHLTRTHQASRDTLSWRSPDTPRRAPRRLPAVDARRAACVRRRR